MNKTSSLVFMLFVLIAGILWDIIAYINVGSEATFSRITLEGAKSIPAIAFGVGFLCGHLFWPIKSSRLTIDSIELLVLIAVVFVVAGVVFNPILVFLTSPAGVFLFGFVSGHTFWPQQDNLEN